MGLMNITTKLEALGFGAKLVETVKATGELPETPDPTKQAKVLKFITSD